MQNCYRKLSLTIFAAVAIFIPISVALAPEAFAEVQALRDGENLSLSNQALSAKWTIHDGALRWQGLTNRFTGQTLHFESSPFEFVPNEGQVLRAADFKIVTDPLIKDATISDASPKTADHIAGRQIRIELEDSHWIGGDPARLEVYGWAAWSPEKAIITLRNPSDRAQDFTENLSSMLELSEGSTASFVAHSPWKKGAGESSFTISTFAISAREQHTFHLEPFQVLSLELLPKP